MKRKGDEYGMVPEQEYKRSATRPHRRSTVIYLTGIPVLLLLTRCSVVDGSFGCFREVVETSLVSGLVLLIPVMGSLSLSCLM